jgi:hypothetical protein
MSKEHYPVHIANLHCGFIKTNKLDEIQIDHGSIVDNFPPLGIFADIYFLKAQDMCVPNQVVCI